MERTKEGFFISTDKARLDLGYLHAWLSHSYWAAGIPRSVVERSVAGSLCFGLYTAGNQQAGFARVVTDGATFAYLCDVFVDETQRGRGLGRWLVQTVMDHPDLQGLRRFLLATRDAHGLYRPLGFEPLEAPDRWLQIHRPYAD